MFYRKQNRTSQARQAFNEALTVRRQLAQENPESYLPNVAETLSNLAVLDRVQNRMGEARKACEEALTIYQDFAKSHDVARVKKLQRAVEWTCLWSVSGLVVREFRRESS